MAVTGMDGNISTVKINVDTDIVTARQEGRAVAMQLGFSSSEQVLIATAISEAARNILQYAGIGTITISRIEEKSRRGILVIASDTGPGIANIEQAMMDGYSSSGGLGLGLSGIKRLMSDLEIISEIGKGTTLIMTRWKL
jgi:serine/threonine-protein kinase RsbT